MSTENRSRDDSADGLQQQLLELVYGLLDEAEVAAVRERIKSDPEAAIAYADAERFADKLAASARLAAPQVELSSPKRSPWRRRIEIHPERNGQSTVTAAKRDAELGSRRHVAASLRDAKFASRRDAATWTPAEIRLSRAMRRTAAIAAGLLAIVTLGGFAVTSWPLVGLESKHIHLKVAGPQRIEPGMDNVFTVETMTPSGRPMAAGVRYTLKTSDGKSLVLATQQATASNGRLTLNVRPAAEITAAENATFEIAAGDNDAAPLSTSLMVEPSRFATQLSLDKPLYQPGEIVRFRSLTLTRFGLNPAGSAQVSFEIHDPSGAVVPNSQATLAGDRGVAGSEFALPVGAAGGEYTLFARSPANQFAEEKRTFFVRQYRRPRLKKDLEFTRDSYAPGDAVAADLSVLRTEGAAAAGAKLHAIASVDGQVVWQSDKTAGPDGSARIEFKLPEKIARGDGQLAVVIDDGGNRETVAKTIRVNLDRVDVALYPEGGDLVAGLENRVYFTARTPLGKPAHIAGLLLDGEQREVGKLETSYKGMGSFKFTPRLGETYSVKVGKLEVNLTPGPLVAESRPAIRLSTGSGVFGPKQPLAVDLEARDGGEPLVVAAYCRDVLVGQQTLTAEHGMNHVEIPLAAGAAGVVRVTVFEIPADATASDPRAVAERLVYRRPERMLKVSVGEHKPRYSPGDPVELSLAVTNERGEPTPALLGVSVAADSLYKLIDDELPSMPTHFYLTSEIERPEDLEKADFFLSDDPKAAAALDLLLGTQGWRRFTDKTGGQFVSNSGGQPQPGAVAAIGQPGGPPILLDNGDRVFHSYQAARDKIFASRSTALGQLGRSMLLAGTPVALLFIFIAAWGAIASLRFWLPTLGTAAACFALAWVWTNNAPSPLGDADRATVAMANTSGVKASQSDSDTNNWSRSSAVFKSAEAVEAWIKVPTLSKERQQTLLPSDFGGASPSWYYSQTNGIFFDRGDFPAIEISNPAVTDYYSYYSPAVSFGSQAQQTQIMPNHQAVIVDGVADLGATNGNSLALQTPTYLYRLGTGALIPPDQNRFTAPLTIGGGTLSLSSSGATTSAFANSTVSLNRGGTFVLGGDNSLSGGAQMNWRTRTEADSTSNRAILSRQMWAASESPERLHAFAETRTDVPPPAANQDPIISADHRYFGISVQPMFSAIGAVETFNFARGATSQDYDYIALTTRSGLEPTDDSKIDGDPANYKAAGWQMNGNQQGKNRAPIAITGTLRVPYYGDQVTQFGSVATFQVRQYAHHHQSSASGARADFAETLYWNPLLITDANGKATIKFDLSDAVAKFRVLVDAHAQSAAQGEGRIGTGSGEVVAQLPVSIEPKLPLEVTAGDRIDLPVAVVNDTDAALPVSLAVNLPSSEASQAIIAPTTARLVESDGPNSQKLDLPASGRSRAYFPLNVTGNAGAALIEVRGQTADGKLADAKRQPLAVVPAGYPVAASYGGILSGDAALTVRVPKDYVPGTLALRLAAYPSAIGEIEDGLDGILREPNGCFEQTSSSNYPNVLILEYLNERNLADPVLMRRCKALLQTGYARLTSYESKSGGFEWFGGDPGHETLSAYGLMEFTEMARVFPVDRAMLERTTKWLLGRRDGNGGFRRGDPNHQFGFGSKDVNDAYITWALTEAGVAGIEAEVKHAIGVGRTSEDPYVIALAAIAAQNSHQDAAARELLDWLAKLQAADGHLDGRESFAYSGGVSLQVETTALAALAWLKQPAYTQQAQKAIEWIASHRQGAGGFGSTQGTILALKALVDQARLSHKTVSAGELVVKRAGQTIGKQAFAAGQQGTIRIDGLASKLEPGENQLAISLTGDNRMPYSLDVSFRSLTGPSDPACAVRLTTKLAAATVKAGETVSLEAELSNATDKPQPMTVAILGLPAGLEPRANQLEELKKAGKIDYYETRPREIVFYWRKLTASQKIPLRLDLVAEVPGQYTAPASRAYLYYTAERKQWTEPLKVTISRE